MKKGFTLLELLIAFAISVFVISAAYSMLKFSVEVKSASEKHVAVNEMKVSIQNIIKSDIFSILNEPVKINNSSYSKSFSFSSMHSLFFSSGVPVTITYLLEKGQLFRIEENMGLGFYEKFTISEGIDEFLFFGFDGNDFRQDYVKTNLFRFLFSTPKGKIEISAGSIFYAP